MKVPDRYKKNMVAFWLCFRVNVANPSQILKAAIMPVCFTLIVIGALVVAVHAFNIRMDEGSEKPLSRALLGARVALAIARKISEPGDSVSDDDAPADPSHLTRVFIDAPQDQARNLEAALDPLQFRASTPDDAQIVMRWLGSRWRVSSKNPGDSLLVYSALAQSVNKMNASPVHSENFTRVSSVLDDEILNRKLKAGRKLLLEDLIPMIMFVILGSLFIGTFVSMGKNMIHGRVKGEFEVYALTRAPFWVYVLSMSAARAVQYTALACLLLMTMGLFMPIMSIASLALVCVGIMFISTAYGVLSSLPAFIFHNQWSHYFGGFLLGPITMLMAFLWFAILRIEKIFKKGAVPGPDEPGLYTSIEQVPYLVPGDTTALIFMAMSIVISVITIGCACRFLEWRLGPRRTGLSPV